MHPSTVISVKRTATGVSANVRIALWLTVAMMPFGEDWRTGVEEDPVEEHLPARRQIAINHLPGIDEHIGGHHRGGVKRNVAVGETPSLPDALSEGLWSACWSVRPQCMRRSSATWRPEPSRRT